MEIFPSVTCEYVNEYQRSGQLRYKSLKVEVLNFEQREGKHRRGNFKKKLLKCRKFGAGKGGSAFYKFKCNWEYCTTKIEMRMERKIKKIIFKASTWKIKRMRRNKNCRNVGSQKSKFVTKSLTFILIYLFIYLSGFTTFLYLPAPI